MKKLLLIIGALLLSAVFLTHPVAAQSQDTIRSFDSKVRINRDGTAHVEEKIVYDFGQQQKHGIFRTIPIDYKDGDVNYYITAMYQQTVDENRQKIQADVSVENGNYIIKLGDPDKTMTGAHTYVISYTLTPVVMKKDGNPFLNLDVLGRDWPAVVENFTAEVMLEDGLALQNVQWFGAEGRQSSASAQNLLPGQSVTINAFLPHNYTTTFLEPNKERPFDIGKFLADFWFLILFVLAVVVAIIIAFARWFPAYQKRKNQTVIPEYDPPKNMSPAEIGLLDDDSADMREMTATVINWAVNGYVKISPIEKKGWFSRKDYKLYQLKAHSHLPEAEKALYNAFFAQGKEVTLNTLDKTKMIKATTEFRSVIKKQLSKAGYYEEGSNILKRGTLTEAGAKKWAQVEGFQLYMTVVEKDRLKFSDAPDKTPERFNALLPYAIALGVEKQWAKQFEGIDVTASTNWYAGNVAAFSAVSLTNDISTSFAATVTSNSVSSSGGSAGSGVGGGGGGSW